MKRSVLLGLAALLLAGAAPGRLLAQVETPPPRPAATLKRPTGPPASRPTMTTTMAMMNPASVQPKMATI